MRLQGTYVVLATAAVTTVFTVSLLAPNGVGAVDAAATIKPLIPQPRLESQGCGFVLKTDKPDYEAGDRPSIEVTASNPADGKAVATKVWVNISARAPASPNPACFRLRKRSGPIPMSSISSPGPRRRSPSSPTSNCPPAKSFRSASRATSRRSSQPASARGRPTA